MPLEYYPPITNMLDSLGQIADLNVKVWSTKNVKDRPFYKNDNLIAIIRTIFPKPGYHKFLRLFTYVWFNLRVFFGLLCYNPKVVCYYETYSAGPVYWYLRLFGKHKKLIIHYHEYFNKQWYDEGMTIVKTYYHYEKTFLLKRADWISHTNTYRRDLFLEEHPYLKDSQLRVMPNYPPDAWSAISEAAKFDSKDRKVLRVVYVGSLSIEHTFIEAFCDWVIKNRGAVTFDIFAYNCSEPTICYLNNLNADNIKFYQKGLLYNDLPKALKPYDVGVILYKANTLNAKYCASNKLFEYLVCGLEVWASQEQLGTIPYLNDNSRPRVLALDFSNINENFLKDFTDARHLTLKRHQYNFSTASENFIETIKSL